MRPELGTELLREAGAQIKPVHGRQGPLLAAGFPTLPDSFLSCTRLACGSLELQCRCWAAHSCATFLPFRLPCLYPLATSRVGTDGGGSEDLQN